jgi:hypothetical protein
MDWLAVALLTFLSFYFAHHHPNSTSVRLRRHRCSEETNGMYNIYSSVETYIDNTPRVYTHDFVSNSKYVA